LHLKLKLKSWSELPIKFCYFDGVYGECSSQAQWCRFIFISTLNVSCNNFILLSCSPKNCIEALSALQVHHWCFLLVLNSYWNTTQMRNHSRICLQDYVDSFVLSIVWVKVPSKIHIYLNVHCKVI
jgi:hypothetical protein